MYRVPLKTAVVTALRNTFDRQYPVKDFADIHTSIEYPAEPQNYPGLWVNYQDSAPVRRAGIAHTETIRDSDGVYHKVSRWTFGGHISITVAAMSSMERDRLVDQVIRVLMASDVDQTLAGRFKESIETNEYLGINFNYDEVNISGESNSPGTPWGSDDILYETTVEIDCIGEFVSDPGSNALLILSDIVFTGYEDNDESSEDPVQDDVTEWDPHQWS